MASKRRRSIARVETYTAIGSCPIRGHLTDVLRAGEWWEYKLVPIFSAFYATAVMLHVPVASLWMAAVTILLSMVPGAAYVSVINDLTDRDEDLAAGKRNRVAGRSLTAIALLIGVTVAAGLVFAWLWRRDVLLLSCYLTAWLAFSLYSLPPFRFKTRGILGVLCDASGAHLFPTLVAVVLAFRAAGRPVNVLWIISIGVWAFAYGLRGILWHQLTDAGNDRDAGVRTFVQRHGPAVVARLSTFVVFPVELVALLAILGQLRSIGPPLLLLFYALAALRRMRRWKLNPVIVAPEPKFLIALHKYYDVLYPLALLITSAARFPIDLIALAVHLLIFPVRALQTARDLWKVRPPLRWRRQATKR
jgi:1,4-dihydroxy-2-naphthoate octaprenyltransferase